MLNFLGKPLVKHQIDTLRKCEINDIIITRKHFKEKINFPGVKYDDKEEDNSNMVADFMHVLKGINEDVLVLYGDIIYEPKVLQKILKEKADIAVVADTKWKNYWTARLGNWRDDSESFMIGKNNKLISLGMPNPPEEKMHARYVGMIKFSGKIIPEILKIYEELSEKIGWENPWRFSKSFKKAYMTDLIQELIERGFNVKAVPIEKGWMEFDTTKDYELALEWLKEKSLSRFINLS